MLTENPARLRAMLRGTLALALGLGLTALIWAYAPQIQQFRQYGYPGLFLVNLLGNASLFVPLPSLAVTFAMGGVLAWPWVGLVSGLGQTLGESTGYLAGAGGRVMLENRRVYHRMQTWLDRYGLLTIFVLALLPNPFFDAAGLVAGTLRFGYGKFLLVVLPGKTLKSLAVAWAGAHSVAWLMPYFN